MLKNIAKFSLALVISTSLFACENTSPSQPTSSASASATPSTAPNSDKADLGKPSSVKLSDFIWEEGKLTFKLPDTMKEVKNTAEIFEASSDAIYFQLLPWKDAKLTKEDVLKSALVGADNVDLNTFKVDEQASGEYELNGFKGYIVVGETKLKDGSDVYLGVMAMIDPSSDANFISYITINKGKVTEDQKNINVASDILASFKKSS